MNTPTIDRTQALKLIGDLATASVKAYKSCNERTRLSPEKACERELKAAAKLFAVICGPDAYVSEQEIEEALGL